MSKKRQVRQTRLNRLKRWGLHLNVGQSFIVGLGRLGDIRGTLVADRANAILAIPADEAMREDWIVVGGHLMDAIDEFSERRAS